MHAFLSTENDSGAPSASTTALQAGSPVTYRSVSESGNSSAGGSSEQTAGSAALLRGCQQHLRGDPTVRASHSDVPTAAPRNNALRANSAVARRAAFCV